ncbi:hypothetical protein IWQ60_011810 [Tieghemiomyces parasiticus]|uniref:RGS domain-containing protein n=1 Tax=Tieghemiomyces parasiticus TaxID=78921 RepID=A0A9W7ZMP9_9FUNG|nr:hypothetical protein IWQ60_011810 [Tieghemiomyces parasiticus]
MYRDPEASAQLSKNLIKGKAIIYISFTAVYVIFVVITTGLFIRRTRRDRHRSSRLIAIETIGTLSLCIIAGLGNAFNPHWPCFLNFWGLYIGVMFWFFGFTARTLHLLFQSEFHQAKLHVTALHPDADDESEGAISRANSVQGPTGLRHHRPQRWDQVLERNELKARVETRRYRFGRLLDRISWDRKRHWFAEKTLLLATAVAFGLVLIYLIMVQLNSPHVSVSPINTHCSRSWEYYFMYGLIGVHTTLISPMMAYWLWDMQDAYGLRTELIIEIAVATASYILFFTARDLVPAIRPYVTNTFFLFVGLSIIHFVSVVVPLWKTFGSSSDAITHADLLADTYDDCDSEKSNRKASWEGTASRRSAASHARSSKGSINQSYRPASNRLSQTIKRQSLMGQIRPPPPPPPVRANRHATRTDPDPRGSMGFESAVSGPHPEAEGMAPDRTLEHRILTNNRTMKATPTTRWNAFTTLLSHPQKFEQFKYYAAACFCTELTLFLEDYQQLKCRVYPYYSPKSRARPPSSPQPLPPAASLLPPLPPPPVPVSPTDTVIARDSLDPGPPGTHQRGPSTDQAGPGYRSIARLHQLNGWEPVARPSLESTLTATDAPAQGFETRDGYLTDLRIDTRLAQGNQSAISILPSPSFTGMRDQHGRSLMGAAPPTATGEHPAHAATSPAYPGASTAVVGTSWDQDPWEDEAPSGSQITIYETIGPIYRPLNMQYGPADDERSKSGGGVHPGPLTSTAPKTRVAIVQAPPVPRHLRSLFVSFHRRYIDPDSALALNIPGPIIADITANIRQGKYSITMFDQAHREVLNMLYDNIYPKYLKMRRTSKIRVKA